MNGKPPDQGRNALPLSPTLCEVPTSLTEDLPPSGGKLRQANRIYQPARTTAARVGCGRSPHREQRNHENRSRDSLRWLHLLPHLGFNNSNRCKKWITMTPSRLTQAPPPRHVCDDRCLKEPATASRGPPISPSRNPATRCLMTNKAPPKVDEPCRAARSRPATAAAATSKLDAWPIASSSAVSTGATRKTTTHPPTHGGTLTGTAAVPELGGIRERFGPYYEAKTLTAIPAKYTVLTPSEFPMMGRANQLA